MNEKFSIPQADRLVGEKAFNPGSADDFFDKPPLDEKGEPITDSKVILRRIFHDVSTEEFENIEIPKSEREVYMVNLATEAVKRFAGELGRKDFVDLPLNNIHFLKEGSVKGVTKGRLQGGSHSTVMGQILIDRRGDIETAITTFHELWHILASHQAVQITTEGTLDWYRSGFAVNSRDGSEEYFGDINEALTGIITKRFVEEVLSKEPQFKDEIEKLLREGGTIDTTREEEVKDFLAFVDRTYEASRDIFDSKEIIINLFLKGQVTGDILPIARVIEAVYGKGSFRKLGGGVTDSDKDNDSEEKV